MLAAFVGIGCITRPEPMVRALVFVQDRLGPVWHERGASVHGAIVAG